MQKFRERLRNRRHSLGWTQETLAHKAGVSPRLIAGIESGETESVTLSKVEELAEALDVSFIWLLGGMDEEKHLILKDEPSSADEAFELLKRASDLIDEARTKLRPQPQQGSYRRHSDLSRGTGVTQSSIDAAKAMGEKIGRKTSSGHEHTGDTSQENIPIGDDYLKKPEHGKSSGHAHGGKGQ